MDPLILVDVYNLAWRSHYAFNNLVHESEPTGVFYGFLKGLLDLRKLSSYVLLCWDGPVLLLNSDPINPNGQVLRGINWRKKIYPQYKASRKHDNLDAVNAVQNQLTKLLEIFDMMNLPSIGFPGLEADDLIGLVCGMKPYIKSPILIYSTDKDLYQLIDASKEIEVLKPGRVKGELTRVSQAILVKEFKIEPAVWDRYLALGGDSSDDIKPLRGLGPKTAIALVQNGINPNLPFSQQPTSIAIKYSKLQPVWETVQACYACAKIPTQFNDPRFELDGKHIMLREHVVNGVKQSFFKPVSNHYPNDYPNDLANGQCLENKFIQFFAEYGLKDFIARRAEFLR